ncbi:MAG: nucleotidyltransferase domain-containing protein [Candidatus Woesearchaeota archaeon]
MTNISQINALIPFASDYGLRIHASMLAKEINRPQKTISRQLNSYCETGLLKYKREGKNKLYYLDLEDPATKTLLNLVESYKSIEFLCKNKKIALLIKELCKKATVILFGSYAKGKATPESDIDLVIMGSRKSAEEIIKKYPFKVSLQYITVQKLKTLIKEKNALALEIKKDHIIFNNFEEIINIFMEPKR